MRPRTSTFPDKTFRVLNERKTREYGEYRTKRLCWRLVLDDGTAMDGVVVRHNDAAPVGRQA